MRDQAATMRKTLAAGTRLLPVARLRADLLEDRLQQVERGEDVVAREGPRSLTASGHERLLIARCCSAFFA